MSVSKVILIVVAGFVAVAIFLNEELFMSRYSQEFNKYQDNIISSLDKNIHEGVEAAEVVKILEDNEISYRFYEKEGDTTLEGDSVWTIPENVVGFYHYTVRAKQGSKRTKYPIYIAKAYIDERDIVVKIYTEKIYPP